MKVETKIKADMKEYLRVIAEKQAKFESEKKKAEAAEGEKKKDEVSALEKNDVFGLNNQETLKMVGFDLATIRKIHEEVPVIPEPWYDKYALSLKEKNLLKIVEKYEGWTVATKEVIGTICVDYNLRLSTVRNYKGRLDDGVSKSIDMFCKEFKDYVRWANFYIIADPKMFEVATVKEVKKKTHTVLLVQSQEDTDTFIIIRQWGNDLDSEDRFEGLIRSNRFAQWVVQIGKLALGGACIGGVVTALICGFLALCGEYPWTNFWSIYLWVNVILFAIVIIVASIAIYDSDNKSKVNNYKKGWHKPY